MEPVQVITCDNNRPPDLQGELGERGQMHYGMLEEEDGEVPGTAEEQEEEMDLDVGIRCRLEDVWLKVEKREMGWEAHK